MLPDPNPLLVVLLAEVPNPPPELAPNTLPDCAVVLAPNRPELVVLAPNRPELVVLAPPDPKTPELCVEVNGEDFSTGAAEPNKPVVGVDVVLPNRPEELVVVVLPNKPVEAVVAGAVPNNPEDAVLAGAVPNNPEDAVLAGAVPNNPAEAVVAGAVPNNPEDAVLAGAVPNNPEDAVLAGVVPNNPPPEAEVAPAEVEAPKSPVDSLLVALTVEGVEPNKPLDVVAVLLNRPLALLAGAVVLADTNMLPPLEVLAGAAELLKTPGPLTGLPNRLEVKGLLVPAGLLPNNPPDSEAGDAALASGKPNGFLGGVEVFASSDDIFRPNNPPSPEKLSLLHLEIYKTLQEYRNLKHQIGLKLFYCAIRIAQI